MRVIAGVDCHKSSHVVVFLDESGSFVDQLAFSADEGGYLAAMERARDLGCRAWGIEGTGSYGRALAVHIGVEGWTVYEVPGAYTKRHRRHGSRKGKSDRLDARAIAEVVLREAGRLPRFHLALREKAIRMRYDQRDRLVRERTRAANRLRNAAVLLGVTELPSDVTGTRTARRILDRALSFREQTLLHEAADAALDELQESAEDILRINERIRKVMTRLPSLVRPMADSLLELRGVSVVVAAGLIGHAGDLRNLRNAAAFAMRAGVAPVPCSSGRSQAVRVNTGGDRQLNRLLHIIAMTQIRSEAHPGALYYQRKRAEGKSHRAAMRCLKRQLATVIYYRLRAQKDADRGVVPMAA